MDTSEKDSKTIEQLTCELARLYSDFDRLFAEVGRIRDSVAQRLTASAERSDILTLLHTLWTKAVGTPTYDKTEWKALEREIIQRSYAYSRVNESVCPWCEARQPVRAGSMGEHVVVCDHCGEGYSITIRHTGIVVVSPPRIVKNGVEEQQVAGDPRGVCGCPHDYLRTDANGVSVCADCKEVLPPLGSLKGNQK